MGRNSTRQPRRIRQGADALGDSDSPRAGGPFDMLLKLVRFGLGGRLETEKICLLDT